MKIQISRDQISAQVKFHATLLSGAGIGMFLAIAFIQEDQRKLFPFRYFVTAWLLVLGGLLLQRLAHLIRTKNAEEGLTHEKHVA